MDNNITNAKTAQTKRYFSIMIDNKKKLLIYSLVFVIIFGLIAHGFAFANFTVNHDALWEYYFSTSAKAKLLWGRFMVPAIEFILGELYVSPWLIGILAMIFIALSTFFICLIFKINNIWELLIISGIMTTNITIVGLIGSYIHDLDVDVLALLFSTLSFFFTVSWKEKKKLYKLIISAIFLTFAVGIYQSYLANYFTLSIIYFIYRSFNKDNSIKKELKFFCITLLVIVASVVLYFGISFAVSRIFNIAVSEGRTSVIINIITHPITLIKRIAKEYARVLLAFFYPNYVAAKGVSTFSTYLICGINIILILYTSISFIQLTLKNKLTKKRILIQIVALLLIPFAMSFVCALTGGGYVIMMNAYWFFYLLVIVISKENEYSIPKINFCLSSCIVFVLTTIVIISNIQMSNLVYVKKESESKATLSFMTNMVNKIELQDDYVYNQTPIAIIGRDELFESLDIVFVDTEGSDWIKYIPGVNYPSALSSYNKVAWYFKVYLHYKVNLVDESIKTEIKEKEEFINMPTYPSNGGIKTIDGIIVIKLPE